MRLFIDIGNTVFLNIVQVIAGCILSIFLYRIFRAKTGKPISGLFPEILLMIGISLSGMAFPLGTYGLLPLIATIIMTGIKFYLVVPLFISNALFNMTVPFTDVSFNWGNGTNRIVLAFAAGILAAIVSKAIKVEGNNLLRIKNVSAIAANETGFYGIIAVIGRNINVSGPYLIVGAVVNSIFHRYVLNEVIGSFYTNPVTSSLPYFFAGYDITNPFFLLAVNIAMMLADFMATSALFVFLRVRAAGLFYIYYSLLALMLSISIFI